MNAEDYVNKFHKDMVEGLDSLLEIADEKCKKTIAVLREKLGVKKEKYRIILLDLQEVGRSDRLEGKDFDAEKLGQLYEERTEQEEECFFSVSYEATDDETAVQVGRGYLFDNDFSAGETLSVVQKFVNEKWTNL